MIPDQFLGRIRREPPAPAYLFIGPEPYQRDLCRKALTAAVVPPEDLDQGLTRYDATETELSVILDDARSLSLFSASRLIWVSGAEGALPRRVTDSGEEGGSGAGLLEYLRNSPTGTVVVFDCSRFEFEGEDKAKLDRVLKFYAAIPDQVEFRPFTPEAARRLAQETAKRLGLQIGPAELGLLVEALGADGGRLVQELEKLSVFAGRERKVTAEDIQQLVPNAQTATIFSLVSALGRGDRKRSLEALDSLLREGEYLPLALTFLGTQFRLALVAHEAKLTNAAAVQAHFTKLGMRVWKDRAEQILATMSAFPKGNLARAVEEVYEADRALRDARPDDRVVMEKLVLALTS